MIRLRSGLQSCSCILAFSSFNAACPPRDGKEKGCRKFQRQKEEDREEDIEVRDFPVQLSFSTLKLQSELGRHETE